MSNFMRRWLGNNRTAGGKVRSVVKPRLGLQSLEARDVPAAYVVNTGGDVTTGFAADSLRGVITALNASTDATNAITFTPSVTSVTLAGALPDIGKNVSITGNGAASTTISGANLYRVLKANDGLTTATIGVSISNLTIANGSATGATSIGSGGGLWNQGESVTLTGVAFTGNKGAATTTTGGGGAIFQTGGSLTVNSSTFTANTRAATAAFYGGAINSQGGTVAITNSAFTGNGTVTTGGAVYVTTGSVNVSNSTFTSNTAITQAGAIYSAAPLAITGSTLTGNSATSTTSGRGGALAVTSTVTITNSTLASNTAGFDGGAIGGTGSPTISISGSTFSGNKAANRGGGIYFYSAGSATISNSTFANNSAGGGSASVGGGAISTYNAALLIKNSTFSGNTATGGGGAISQYSSSTYVTPNITIVSSIIAGNGATISNPSIYRGNAGAGTVSITNSVIGVGDDFVSTGSGNVSGTVGSPLDPQLDPLANYGGPTQTFQLKSTSPAIDIGSNSDSLGTDQRGAGFARTKGTATDAGAFEAPSALPGVTGGPYADITTPTTTYTFAVTYFDTNAVNYSKVNGNNAAIQVTGPNGYSQFATFVSATPTNNATSITATYTITAPAVGANPAGFDGNDAGAYTITLQGGQIADTDTPTSNTIPLTPVGTFLVNLPATITVNSTGDDVTAGDGKTTFREALIASNATAGKFDTITFDSTVFNAATTITLTSALPTITDGVVIDGKGKAVLDGAATYRVLSVGTTIPVTLSNLTVQNGFAAGGAGISATSVNLTLDGVTVKNNVSSGSGSGISVAGVSTLTITNSTIQGNSFSTVALNGGGLQTSGTATVTISKSTFSGNSASRQGGGAAFLAGGTLLIQNSTFSGNTSGLNAAYYSYVGGGGAAFTSASVTIDFSTFTANDSQKGASTIAATGGGGIRINSGSVSITNSIVAGNTDYNGKPSVFLSAGAVTVTKSVIGAADVFTFTNGGGNATGTAASPLDPLLNPLANNGGPTQTHSLKAGSPALNLVGTTTVTVDQTGAARVQGGAADAGAVESAIALPTGKLGSAANVTTSGGTTYSFTVIYTSGTASINVGSINPADVTVTGPNGFTATISGAVASPATNASPVTVTYTFTAPGGTFDAADNGTYSIALNAGQVFDTNSQAVTAGPLGGFLVAIPATITVNSTGDDTTPNDGLTTLREAVIASNLTVGSTDTIVFDPTVFAAAQTVTLTNGVLSITDSVVITGTGSDKLAVSGGGASQIFNVAGAGTLNVAINKLTLTQGSASLGGAVFIDNESVTFTNVVLTANTATTNGGAIYVLNSGATVNIVASTLSGNVASGTGTINGGGAVFAYNSGDTFNVTGSTVSGNQGNRGAGFYFYFGATAIITNSTFADNTSTNGGGAIGTYGGTLTLNYSTVARNTSTGTAAGGGIGTFSSTSVTVTGSIIGDNTSGGTTTDIGGTGSFVFNNSLIGSASGLPTYTGTGSVVGVPTGLDTNGLAANGAAATVPLTIALLTGQAINLAGATTIPYDERGVGFPRVVGGSADAGAFESSFANPTAKLGSAPTVTVAGGTTGTFTVVYTSGTASIKVSTVNAADVTVTGPGGPVTVTGATASPNANASPVTVTYTYAAPGGTFDAGDNGVYTIAVNANEVQDTAGLFVPAATVGSFNVGIGQSFTVTNNADNGAGSLRQAILDSNANGNNTIAVDSITFTAGANGTIALTSNLDAILGSASIDATGTSVTVDGGGTVQPFFIGDGTTFGTLDVTFKGFTIANGLGQVLSGNTGSSGGAIIDAGQKLTLNAMKLLNNKADVGGGIFAYASAAALTLVNSTVSGNTATLNATAAYDYGYGGGIHVNGASSVIIDHSAITGNTAGQFGGGLSLNSTATITATDSTISNNTAGDNGGAIFANTGSTINATRSTFADNVATAGDGGGLFLGGSATTVGVLASTFSGNTAGRRGGAVYFFSGGSLTAENSTFANNVASGTGTGDGGGAIHNYSASLTLTNSTFSGNSAAGQGGAINNYSSFATPSIVITNSIIAGNTAVTGPDIVRANTTGGALAITASVIGVADNLTFTGTGNATGTTAAPLDAKLGALASNGGPTQTFALLAGSPAINLGAATSPYTTDQAGQTRVVGGKVDAGAFEYQVAGDVVVPTASGTFSNVTTRKGATYQFAVTLADNVAVQASTVQGADFTVTGPDGYSKTATLVSLTPAGNGSPLVATLTVPAPGGAFDVSDNGTYTVSVTGSITDTSGNAVAAGSLGTFAVQAPVAVQSVVTKLSDGTTTSLTTAGQRSLIPNIVITYDGIATGANLAASYKLLNTSTNATVAVNVSTTTVAGHTVATVTPVAPLANAYYTFTAFGTAIATANLSPLVVGLDGDNNGTAGGNFVLDFHRFAGDVTGDTAVDGDDLAGLAAAFNSVEGDANYRAYLDLDGDGAVDGNDLAIFAQSFLIGIL